MKTKYIIEMPDGWKPEPLNDWKQGMPPKCGKCPFRDTYDDENDEFCSPGNCPLANAKEAIRVKFGIDKETGLSVIDANGKFHFEWQDKYYAVAVDK